jgi:RNase H-like domain found in reverse transcriptase
VTSELHLVAFHSWTFSSAELNYDFRYKELLVIFKAFKCWWHYLEGSGTPIDVVTDHKNLEYFSTTKLLTQWQANWSEYLSQFNPIIQFHPRKLSTKPNTLTRWCDIYLKEGGNDYGQVNPQNLQPVITNQQLLESLQATYLLGLVLWASTVIDSEQLHANIIDHLASDPMAQKHLSDSSDPRWTQTSNDFLCLNGWIYIPEAENFWLWVLQYKHDHVLLGYFSQNKTLTLIHQ